MTARIRPHRTHHVAATIPMEYAKNLIEDSRVNPTFNSLRTMNELQLWSGGGRCQFTPEKLVILPRWTEPEEIDHRGKLRIA